MSNAQREARALGLFERIAVWRRAGEPRTTEAEKVSPTALVRRWETIVAGGDKAIFNRRLTWDNLSQSDAIDAFSWVSANPEAAANSAGGHGWCDDLNTIFEDGLSEFKKNETGRFRGWALEDGIPFVELWAPWLAAADAALRRHGIVRDGRMTPSAVDSLLRHLLRQISDLCSEPAFTQFARARSAEVSALDRGDESGFYREWMTGQLGECLEPLFEEYPVMARQLFLLLTTWKASTIELMDRLQADRLSIEAMLGGGDSPDHVIEVQAGLSDRHHHGRRVAIVVFESGEKAVYKPRSLAIEAAFAEFVEWLIGLGLSPKPTLPKLIVRDGYGWMEYVGPRTFDRSEHVAEWFTAAGAMLCVAHILRASDLHFDNVLVGADSPVLVDLETLMHPVLATVRGTEETQTAAARVAGWMRSSFQSTGMLSFLQEGPDGAVIDIGGLCGTGGHELADSAIGWEDLGCDALRKVSRRTHARNRCNVPIVGVEPIPAVEHLDDLQVGFGRAYRLLLDRRAELLDDGSLMRGFLTARSRALLRPTEQYARVLQLSMSPACQRDGAMVGLVVEALHRGLIHDGPRPANWDLVAWERRDLENLDIPRWTVGVDADVFETPDGKPIEGVIARSGRRAFEDRIREMSEDDLQRQLQLMALTLETEDDIDRHTESETVTARILADSEPTHAVSQDVLLAEARVIADELMTRAVVGEDGSMIWLDPAHLIPQGRKDRGVSYYLYSGSLGIALFFAAMERAIPGSGYRDVVDGALVSVINVLRAPNATALLASEGLGACHGLGGIIYTLTVISDLLDETGFLDTAQSMAGHITPERIASDAALDVEGGAAGAVLGLMALHDRTADTRVLETALKCGRWLLDNQHASEDRGAGWPSRQGGMLAGLAHGASGIALAMMRLWRRTGEDLFLDSGRRALEFENTLFDPFVKNWPLRLFDAEGAVRESRNMTAWCHGAPGIALARSCVRDVLPTAEAMGTLEAAVDTTLAAHSSAGPDHLCCGTLGQVEVLLTVASELERPALRLMAESRAAMVIRSAASRGAYRLGAGNQPARAGFFRGLAGVGYQMLRLRRPDEVPSVLAFQTVDLGGRAG